MLERAVVTRVAPGGVYVRIPRLTGREEHGPHQQLWSPYLVEPTADPSSTEEASTHVHPIDLRPLLAGDEVLVASVGMIVDDYVVLGRLV